MNTTLKMNATINWNTIAKGTIVSGILDALAGIIVYFLMFGYNPIQVLQSITEGIQGPSAFAGGLLAAFAGLLLHFFIAFVCTIVYYVAYIRLSFLHKHIFVNGLLFGAAVWVVMNLLVIPHSNIPAQPFNATLAFTGIVWHMFLVGLPIALIIQKQFNTPEI